MKKTFLSLLTAVAFLGLAQTSRANSSYLVDINTSALLGTDASLSGPFSLEFLLQAGSLPSVSNTVTLSGFTFTGGSAVGSLTDLTGGSNFSGSTSSSITMTSSTAHPTNDIGQGFSAGTSDIKFNVNLTNNLTGTSPEGFFISIDDSSGFWIPTTAPDGTSLLVDSFGSSDPANNAISVYESSGVSPAGHDTSGVTLTAPESGPGLWVLAALAGTVTLVRRSRKA
jgi:hypothetical protein